MQKGKEKEERVIVGRSFINLIFSWSLEDVLNNHLYKNQVKQIPRTFTSAREYLNSFNVPLVAETHADLSSSMTTLSHSPCCQTHSVKKSKGFNLPKDLFYNIVLKSSTRERNSKAYDPKNGDLIALMSVRPRHSNDLNKSYVIAYVHGVKGDSFVMLSVLSSQPIFDKENAHRNDKSVNLFAVYLINMTTNVRIWQALTSDPNKRNMKVIERVLQTNSIDQEKCTICDFGNNLSDSDSDVEKRVRSSGLNESQQTAVLSCIGSRKCRHESTVKLIWGPPGTGKTNTVGFMLQSLLRMKCRTLTCAPTNVAILEVTERLVKRVTMESRKYDTYGLGDIVLFGNGERMKIDEREELYSVFLDRRIDMIGHCFAAKTGWGDSLLSLISMLEDPLKHHDLYLQEKAVKWLLGDYSDSDGDMDKNALSLENRVAKRNQEEGGSRGEVSEDKERNKALKEQKKKETNEDKDQFRIKNRRPGEKGNGDLVFEEFIKKRFDFLVEQLYSCMVNLCTHLPTSLISPEVLKTMYAANDALKSFLKLLRGIANEELKGVFAKDKASEGHRFSELREARMRSIFLLKLLPANFPVPYSTDSYAGRKKIREFFLAKACLIFCTVSSSANLHDTGMTPLELLVIDEAAQLKECESTIPLQLPGICHAVLIGDERQLPAMVKSKVSEEADFGRSLFERLASLGHKKQLLNVQHRMHPSISLFPNREFYNNKILDGPNVKLPCYNRSFLQGNMFGSYSFINVTHGKEAVDTNHSTKNMVEVAVVSEIVATLYKEVECSKKKVRVGVISPYKAQVYAISERFAKTYSSDPQSDFSVSVRSVDGFQGGEEDVIIIYTVRSNGHGSVGFLSNRQRTNVALTRARHCLWIVGDGSTLGKSCSVWKKLVIDAKERRCFHNAEADKNLARAIIASLVEINQIHVSLNLVSLLFRESKWKVYFDDAFWISMARFKDYEFCKEALSLIEKLSCGWRRPKNENNISFVNLGKSSLCQLPRKIVPINRALQGQATVWGVLELLDLQRLSKQLDMIYESYTTDKMSRCKHKHTEENLVVPMKWPVDSDSGQVDPLSLLSEPLAALSLKDEPETSSANRRQPESSTNNSKLFDCNKPKTSSANNSQVFDCTEQETSLANSRFSSLWTCFARLARFYK